MNCIIVFQQKQINVQAFPMHLKKKCASFSNAFKKNCDKKFVHVLNRESSMNYDNKCKKKKMVFMHLYNSFYHGLDNFF